MSTYIAASKSVPRRARRVQLLLTYVLVVFSGVYWYWSGAERATSFSPIDLGLTWLKLWVVLLFFGICVARGFTVWRVLLLLVPYAVTTFLDSKLMSLAISQGSQAGYPELRQFIVIAVSYLALMLLWVAAFPLPFSWEIVPADRRPLWRRVEWALAAMFAALLLTHAFHLISLTENLSTAEPVVAFAKKLVARGMHREALFIYLFASFRIAMRLELAERYPAEVPPADSH